MNRELWTGNIYIQQGIDMHFIILEISYHSLVLLSCESNSSYSNASQLPITSSALATGPSVFPCGSQEVLRLSSKWPNPPRVTKHLTWCRPTPCRARKCELPKQGALEKATHSLRNALTSSEKGVWKHLHPALVRGFKTVLDNVQGSETILSDTTAVGTCHYTLVKTHRMDNTHNET